MERELLGISNVHFNAAGQLLIIYCAFVNLYLTAHHLWCVHFKSASYERAVSGALRPFKYKLLLSMIFVLLTFYFKEQGYAE